MMLIWSTDPFPVSVMLIFLIASLLDPNHIPAFFAVFRHYLLLSYSAYLYDTSIYYNCLATS